MNSYERFCFGLVGYRMKARREKYTDLRNALKSARMKASFEVYASTAFVTSIHLGDRCGDSSRHDNLLSKVARDDRLPWASARVASLPLRVKPSCRYSNRGRCFIYRHCGHYLIWSLCSIRRWSPGTEREILMQRSRMPSIISPQCRAQVFHLRKSSASSANSTMYGESAVEASYVTREIDMFGKDLVEAIRITAMSTPSDRMKEFFQGAIGSVASGSNLTVYFRTKSEQYALENRQEQKLFLETLSLIAESYVTAMVARPSLSYHSPVNHVGARRRESADLPVRHHLPYDPIR